MAWWDEVLGLIKDEWKALGPAADSAQEPPTIKQAQSLLTRTTRELADAKARAEAARRRMLRAQAELEALTRDQLQHPRYRERLSDLARAVTHEGDMAASFDTHIATLGAVHDRIAAQLREFNRDVSMARAAHAANQTTQAASELGATARRETTAPSAPNPKASEGFAHKRPDKVMEQLKRGPRSAKPADEKDKP